MRRLVWMGLMMMVLLFSGCAKDGMKQLESENIPMENIVCVNVISSCGSVSIEPGRGKSIQIETSYLVTSKSEERRQLIGDHVSVTTDLADASVLTILSNVGNGVTLDADERADIHLTVRVPSGMGSVVVQSDKGDVTIRDMKGCEVSVVNKEGGVDIENCIFAGNSSIVNVIGSVKMKLKSIEHAEEIRVSTDIGDIALNVPKSASYMVTLEQLGQMGRTSKNKSGKTRIFLTAKTGIIRFQK